MKKEIKVDVDYVEFFDDGMDIWWSWNKGNLLPPKLDDRQALVFLQNYLLGKDWYVVSPLSHEQVNVELVHDILYKFSKEYRKEYKKSLKGEEND